MTVLGIDYGLSKVGVAVASSSLAEPLEVIKFSQNSELIDKLGRIVIQENIQKIVIGIPEGEMREKIITFTAELKEKLSLPVELFDETLTTKDAQNFAIESGMKRVKRHKMEDAFAAAVMLQSYLDNA